MTRQRTYIITAIAAALYVFLCWAFEAGLFGSPFWNSDAIAASSIWTYVLLALIVAAGIYQARQLPPQGVPLRPIKEIGLKTPGQVDDPPWWLLLLGNVYLALIWMPLRFFVGRSWLSSGEEKVRGSWGNGESLAGFWQRAVAIPESGQPDIKYSWYRDFLQYMLDHRWNTWFADVIAWGELLVGLGLLVGALVGFAAFFGMLMNFNYQLAGSASSNPVLFTLSVFLILAWKVAGYWGLDRYVLRWLGTPWKPGPLLGGTSASPSGPVTPRTLRTN